MQFIYDALNHFKEVLRSRKKGEEEKKTQKKGRKERMEQGRSNEKDIGVVHYFYLTSK